MSKYFLLAFICFSLAQVQGNELENAIRKGLIKVEALYNRGVQRIDNAKDNQGDLIQTTFDSFIEKIRRMREDASEAVRSVAQTVEEKAKESNKPDSVFECISKAENNTNKQIQAFATRFEVYMESSQIIYSNQVQMAARPLEIYSSELKLRYENAIAQIKICKFPRCVEITVNNYYMYVENVFDGVKRVQTQISTLVGNFQREARTSFNNVNRQVNRVKIDGSREMRECIRQDCL